MTALKINPKVVDISHYDNVGPTPRVSMADGFKAIKAAGILGVINKASQSTGMADVTFARRRDACEAAGLRYAAYHYITAEDVKAQAAHFLDVCGTLDGLDLALDHEERAVSLKTAQTFLQIVADKAGRMPMLYSGFLIKEQLKGSSPFWSKVRLWLSHYSAKPTWPSCWAQPWLWQFTGDGAGPAPHTIPGVTIPKGLDINSWQGTDQELLDQWAK